MQSDKERREPSVEEITRSMALEELRLKYAAEAQSRRIQFWTLIFTAVMSVVTPILLRTYHAETVDTVNDSRRKVREDIEEQSEEIKKRAEAAVAVSTKAAEVASKIEEKVDAVGVKTDATNLQWRAYQTKNPDDETKAKEVLAEAIKGMQ